MKRLRLILGDQLNADHTWFATVDPDVTYVMMEVRSETDYVVHHAQKVIAIFAAMRRFADLLRQRGHTVRYLRIGDADNTQNILKNLDYVTHEVGASHTAGTNRRYDGTLSYRSHRCRDDVHGKEAMVDGDVLSRHAPAIQRPP